MSVVRIWSWYGYYFLLGNLSFWILYQHSFLLIVVNLVSLLASLYMNRLSAFAVYLIGFGWALIAGYLYSPVEIQKGLSGNQLITGIVTDVVGSGPVNYQYTLTIDSINQVAIQPIDALVYCNAPCPKPNGGESWQLVVKLHPISGRYNPASFDYERWLFSKAIQTKAYIQNSSRNIRLSSGTGLTHIRQQLKNKLHNAFVTTEISASLSALLIGFRGDLTRIQRDKLSAAGLSHLIAISGLHVGLAMIPGMWLGSLVWCLMFTKSSLNRQQIQWFSGFVVAFVYALVSGFGIPAQRSIIMMLVLVCGNIKLMNTSSMMRLGLAIGVILLIHPRAVLDLSFWLTVVVTFLIMIGMIIKSHNRLNTVFYLQIFLAFMLCALQLYFFASYSLLSLFQNLWAIPFISLVLLPLGMLWLCLRIIIEILGFSVISLEWFTHWLGFLTYYFWFVIDYLSELNDLFRWHKSQSLWLNLTLFLLLFILWLNLRSRIVTALVAVMLLLTNIEQDEDEMELFFFDIGQGTAIAIVLGDNLLIYDSGYGNDDIVLLAGILPNWMLTRNLTQINYYIESHEDADHSGGTDWLLQNYPVEHVLSPSRKIRNMTVQNLSCRKGLEWNLGAADFIVISPDDSMHGSDNNRSCVILIRFAGKHTLLTGDIEAATERLILQNNPQLKADIISVPHHGSKTSSSSAFLSQLQPSIAINNAGYRNRFGFPHPRVINRYIKNGAAFYDTGENGLIHLSISSQGEININLSRQQNPALWRRN